MQYGQTLSLIEQPAGDPKKGYPVVMPILSAFTAIEIDEGLNGRSRAEGWVFGDLAIFINDDGLHVIIHLPTKVEILQTNSCWKAWAVKIALIRIGADIEKMINDRSYAQHVIRVLVDFLDPAIVDDFLL